MPNTPISGFRGEFGFLSNFFQTPAPMVCHSDLLFLASGRSAPTLEHLFQAAKTDNPLAVEAILAAPTPGRAKRLGKPGFCPLRKEWDDVRIAVMAVLLNAKFSQPAMKEQLLATGERSLTEGNSWHDTFWGRCFCPTHNGAGTNMLGILLTITRAVLREN